MGSHQYFKCHCYFTLLKAHLYGNSTWWWEMGLSIYLRELAKPNKSVTVKLKTLCSLKSMSLRIWAVHRSDLILSPTFLQRSLSTCVMEKAVKVHNDLGKSFSAVFHVLLSASCDMLDQKMLLAVGLLSFYEHYILLSVVFVQTSMWENTQPIFSGSLWRLVCIAIKL